MHVDDAAFKCAKKISLEHAHKTGEHNQIHFRILQRFDKCALGVFVQLGAKFSRRNELRGQIAFARVRENSRIFHVAQNDGDLRGNFSRSYGVGNRDKVRAFAGTEHANSEMIAHGNLNNRIRLQKKAGLYPSVTMAVRKNLLLRQSQLHCAQKICKFPATQITAMNELPANAKKILVIDDNKIILKTTESMLASKGYRVLTADSGAETLLVLRKEKPDVILLDLDFAPDASNVGGPFRDGFLILDWARR